MNEQQEYLGFAMVDPEQGPIVHVFDLDHEGIKKYGPYKLSFGSENDLPPDEADILLLSFRDGTMPITLTEFVDRTGSADSWSGEQYDIFTKVDQIGSTYFMDPDTQKKMNVIDVMHNEGANFFIDMFEQCVDCLERMNGNVPQNGKSKKRGTTKADKLLDKHFPNISNAPPMEGLREAVLDMLNEAYDSIDAATIRFIVEQERDLLKKRVASDKRISMISKSLQKRKREAAKKRNKMD